MAHFETVTPQPSCWNDAGPRSSSTAAGLQNSRPLRAASRECLATASHHTFNAQRRQASTPSDRRQNRSAAGDRKCKTRGFLKILGTFGGPYKKDYGTLGSVFGSPFLGKLPYCAKEKVLVKYIETSVLAAPVALTMTMFAFLTSGLLFPLKSLT